VLAGQRIGILGANGQGKSTLVKTIARELAPLAGTMTEGKGLAIGYFAQQELDLLNEDDTPLQRMIRLVRETGREGKEQELRDFLGRFRFVGDMVHQLVGTLSGGERARLVLATIVWQRPNLLLLDEPTNHLDLTTREALSIALNEFDGTVMLVSHDRAMLREVCDEFWLVTRGGVLPFDGDLDDYQRWLLDVSRANARGTPQPPLPGATAAAAAATIAATVATAAAASGKRAASTGPTTPPTVKNNSSAAGRKDDRKQAAQAREQSAAKTRPLRVEIQQIDARLVKLGTESRELEASLAAGKLAKDAIVETSRRLNHIAAEVAKLEERWLELQSQVEAMVSSAGG
jgi:ATP-binding cassette subfamily F protein 3